MGRAVDPARILIGPGDARAFSRDFFIKDQELAAGVQAIVPLKWQALTGIKLFLALFRGSRHRMVELLWTCTSTYQRWTGSLLVEKGLSPQRLRILGSIHERGPRIMSDLKKELSVTATNVTALVYSLEKDGLVVRRRHPTDRRATVSNSRAR